MSAVVISKSSIDQIVSFCANRENQNHIKMPCLLDSAKERNLFGQKLLDMNITAVNVRYPETPSKCQRYRFSENTATASSIQVLKSLQCLLYQCAEGDTPETDLYKKMDSLASKIAMFIVTQSPEYQVATWG